MERSATVDVRGRVSVQITGIEDEDRKRLNAIVDQFVEATEHANQTVGHWVKDALETGRLDWEAIERLSVWCDTNMGPRSVVNSARELCLGLFGTIPVRLRETGSETRVGNYRELTADFAAVVNASR